jgi:hypothetical protein
MPPAHHEHHPSLRRPFRPQRVPQFRVTLKWPWTWRSLRVTISACLIACARHAALTLDLDEGLLEELLLESGLGELVVNVLSHRLDQGDLLLLPLLLLEPDPAVEHRLELRLDGLLLSEQEVLVLERVGLLGDGVELLGQGDDLLELVDGVDASGDGLGVLGAGRVEDALDALRWVSG